MWLLWKTCSWKSLFDWGCSSEDQGRHLRILIWRTILLLNAHLQGHPSLEWRRQGDHRELQGSRRKCTRGRKEGPDWEGEKGIIGDAGNISPVHHKLVGSRELCADPSSKVLPGSFRSSSKRGQFYILKSDLLLKVRQSKRGKSRSSL